MSRGARVWGSVGPGLVGSMATWATWDGGCWSTGVRAGSSAARTRRQTAAIAQAARCSTTICPDLGGRSVGACQLAGQDGRGAGREYQGVRVVEAQHLIGGKQGALVLRFGALAEGGEQPDLIPGAMGQHRGLAEMGGNMLRGHHIRGPIVHLRTHSRQEGVRGRYVSMTCGRFWNTASSWVPLPCR